MQVPVQGTGDANANANVAPPTRLHLVSVFEVIKAETPSFYYKKGISVCQGSECIFEYFVIRTLSL